MDKATFKKEVEALKLKIRKLEASINDPDKFESFEKELLEVCREIRAIEKKISIDSKVVEKKMEEQIEIFKAELEKLAEFKRPFSNVGMFLEDLSKTIKSREIALVRQEDPDYSADEEESDEEYRRKVVANLSRSLKELNKLK